MLKRAETFTIKSQFLPVLISRVRAVHQLLKEQADFALRRAARGMHQPATYKHGSDSISCALNWEANIVLRQRFWELIVHANDLLSNFHKALGHFGKALAWPGRERFDDLTLYAVTLHAHARALKPVGRLPAQPRAGRRMG